MKKIYVLTVIVSGSALAAGPVQNIHEYAREKFASCMMDLGEREDNKSQCIDETINTIIQSGFDRGEINKEVNYLIKSKNHHSCFILDNCEKTLRLHSQI